MSLIEPLKNANVWKSPSVIVLVLANLIPLGGVLFFGWQVFPIMFLFWLENVVVGAFNVVKMILARGPGSHVGVKLFLVPFFTVHYGIFTLVHGVFVFRDVWRGLAGLRRARAISKFRPVARYGDATTSRLGGARLGEQPRVFVCEELCNERRVSHRHGPTHHDATVRAGRGVASGDSRRRIFGDGDGNAGGGVGVVDRAEDWTGCAGACEATRFSREASAADGCSRSGWL
jgi:hypothetical protein